MENKFINRYHSYCKCLDNLKKSLTANPADDYDGEYAMAVFSRIITEYYSLFEKLKNTLEKYYVGDGTQADFFAK